MEKVEPKPRRKLHGCVVALVVLFVIALIVIMALPSFIRWGIERRISQTELQRLEIFKTKPVNFPAEWEQAQPVPADLEPRVVNFKLAHDAFQGSTGYSLLSRINSALTSLYDGNGHEISAESWTSLSLIRDSYAPLHQAAHALVSHPRYGIQCLSPESGPESLMVVIISKAAVCSAYVAKREQDTTGALSFLVTAHMLGRDLGEPIAGIHRLAQDTVWALRHFARVAESASMDELRVALELLNREAPFMVSHPIEVQLAEPYLYEIRKRAADGFEADFKRGKTSLAYMVEMNRVCSEYPAWMLARMTLYDPRRSRIQAEAENARERGGSAWYMKTPHGMLAYDILFLMATSDDMFDRQTNKSREIRARFDLARLYLAARILPLSGAVTTEEAVLALLPDAGGKPLSDPFSADGKSYPFDSMRQHYYSVGVDGIDDHQTSRGLAQREYIGDDIVALSVRER